MSHADHGSGEGGGGMAMSFHGGHTETILFAFWKTEKTGVFIASLIIVFFMSFGYEALKFWRDRMLQEKWERVRETIASRASVGTQLSSPFHLLQTVLHMVQFVLSYFLMLIFMTYNTWLALAVTLGAGVGYFCFGWRKTESVDVTEHCH